MRPMRVVSVFLFAALCAIAPAQTVLSEYLAKRGWDPAKAGPMMVLEPESVRSKEDAGSLSDFQRSLMHAGGLSVIAPSEMVLIDDSFSEPPNMYDGLDRNDKILYLLTLLDDQQWSEITSRGISMGDLQGEARAVMKSLLPNPFRWISVPLDGKGRQGRKEGSGTVPEDELSGVRLKLDRGLSFQIKLRDGGQTTLGTTLEAGSPGDLIYERDWNDRGVQHNPYGMHALRNEPNQPKKSQLIYASPRLNTPVSPAQSGTIKDAVALVSKATGVEVHADLRVANRALRFYGDSCRAGDLLEGIALTVTGTYRQVGPAFVLTSDLEGSGGRMVKFSVWESTAQAVAERRAEEWSKKIAQSGRLPEVKFGADSPFAPNDAMKAELAKSETKYTNYWMPSTEMTAGARQFLDYAADMYKTQPMDTEKSVVTANIQYRFILPNGQAMSPEGELGQPWGFYQNRAERFYGGDVPQQPPFLVQPAESPYAPRPALVAAEDPQTASQIIDYLKGFGFGQVWLQTSRQDVLQAAIERGNADSVRIRLVIRPWELGRDSDPNDEDKTILGETGEQVAKEEQGLDLWKSWADEFQDAPLQPYLRVTPSAPSLPARWQRLAAMARTAGLSGIAIDDVQPPGYEGEHVDYLHGNQEKPLGELTDFGYSVNQRLRFLRGHSVDPIDMMGERLMVRTDLRQPFFPDNATKWGDFFDHGPDNALRAAALQWDADRSASYKRSLDSLIASLPTDLPGGIMTTRVHPAIDDFMPSRTTFVLWPDVPETPGQGRVVTGDRQWTLIYRFPPSGKDDTDTPATLQLRRMIGRPAALCFDLRQIPLKDLADVLTKTFRKVKSSPGSQ